MHCAPLNFLTPVANTTYGTKTMPNRRWWSDQHWPRFCFPLCCALSHGLGISWAPPPTFLVHFCWPSLCCGASCVQELHGNLVHHTHSHLSHFSITSPSSHLDTRANIKEKGNEHPMGQPLTINHQKMGAGKKKMSHSSVSQGISRCLLHSSSKVPTCVTVALISNQLIIHPSIGFPTFPISLSHHHPPHPLLPGPRHLWFIWNTLFAEYMYLSQWLWLFPDRMSCDEWLLRRRTNRSAIPRSINR